MELCSYINWHSYFHELTFKSVCIPLPDEIVEYFIEEVIILPEECYEEEKDFDNLDTYSSNSEDEEEQLKVIMFVQLFIYL